MAIAEECELQTDQLCKPVQSGDSYVSALHLGLIALTLVFSLILISVATVNSALAQPAKPLQHVAQLAGQQNEIIDLTVVDETKTASSSKILTGGAWKTWAYEQSYPVARRNVLTAMLISMLALMLWITRNMLDGLMQATRVCDRGTRRGKKA